MSSKGPTPTSKHNYAAFEIFDETFEATRHLIQEQIRRGGYDVIIEIGCSTGSVIGNIETNHPRYGIDIKESHIEYCKQQYPDCQFHVVHALRLLDWWKTITANNSNKNNKPFRRPLLVCVNNALGNMPEHHRSIVVEQMLAVAGKEGMCMASYWDGNFFSHAIVNYYHINKDLCQPFDILHGDHVDWEQRRLTVSGKESADFSTVWHTPAEVQNLFRAMDVDVPNLEQKSPKWGKPHMYCSGLAIFVWFDQSSTSNAKGYYDSDDAQKFYSKIWGEETLHVGRYDLIPPDEDKLLSNIERVARAQELHELEFVKLIKEKTQMSGTLRIVDMGCGYGGMLRRLWKEGLVWNAVGVDISRRMCEQARRFNADLTDDIEILEQSYLDMSLPDESADLVISMDALLHVGPERQRRAMAEAARILRPGGWIIFSDIMQEEVVDAVAMKPIYDRINLPKMGTVSNYQSTLQKCGFSQFFTDLHSENIPQHYGTVLDVLREKGLKFEIATEFQTKMEEGLSVWHTQSPNNIVWGFIAAQKTKRVKLRAIHKKIGK